MSGPDPIDAAAAREIPGDARGPSAPLRTVLLLAFVVTAGLGVARVNERVRGLDDFRVDASRASVLAAPEWMPPAERAALARAAASGARPSLHEDGLPDRLAAPLGADPRVRRVLGARRLHPDSVEVVVELRRPVATVEAAGGSFAVDEDGVRLPGSYPGLPLPRIRGVAAEGFAEGKPCGKGVAAAAAVAAAVPEDLRASLGLTVLEPVKGDATRFVLRRPAAPGTTAVAVEWGRSPAAADAALDPDPACKVRLLRLAAERFPGLSGVRTVRVCFDALVVSR